MRRARGPWRTLGRPELAECSEAFRSQPESREHFPATASRTGRRPSSGTRLLREAGTLGKAPTSLPSSFPEGPSPPPGAGLERPRRGRRIRLRMTRAVGLLSRWLPSASVAPVQPAPWRGAGEGRPPPVAPAIRRGRGLSSAWGSAGRRKGTTEPAQRSQEEQCEWILKLAEIPPQLAAAGGAACGVLGLWRPRVSSRQSLLLGPLTLLRHPVGSAPGCAGCL